MGQDIEKRQRDIILDSINEGVFTVGPDWRITAFNRAAEQITGVSREHALGRACFEVFHANICEQDCALTEILLRYSGNRKRAARDLGIHVSTLFRKIRAVQIDVTEMDGRVRRK